LRPDAGLPTEFPPPERAIAVEVDEGPGEAAVASVVEIIHEHEKGVILAGAMNPGTIGVDDVLDVAAKAGWPILAEPTSQLRIAAPDSGAAVVSTGSYLVQEEAFNSLHRPDAVLLLGSAPPHRSLQRWLKGQAGCRTLLIGDDADWFDESLSFTDVVRSHRGRFFAALRAELTRYDGRDAWQQTWLDADEAATSAIGRGLIESALFEGRVVTALAGVLPDDASLYVGNSLAVRDVNLYWPRRDGPIDIYSNRGASGIDGLLSSALGVAAGTSGPVVLLLGDLSLLHDLSGLMAAVRLQIPLAVVVVNNDGGGIFSFLPFADMGDEIRFNDLFHTPHGSDLGAVVTGIGAGHHLVGSSTDLQQAVIGAMEADGPTVIEVQLDALSSVTLHREIDAVVRRALTPAS
jgi:2-succinyl-5-enolpyruvyl-6-hydroxy-3-cyclohexene-1-carboxylate synthase